MRKFISQKILALCAALVPMLGQAAVIASSQTEFSNEQGLHGWRYGYYAEQQPGSGYGVDVNAFHEMTQYSTEKNAWFVQDGTFYTELNATGGHPNGSSTTNGRTPYEQWAVRRWVSDVAGEITISAYFQTNGSTNGRVFLDGRELPHLNYLLFSGRTVEWTEQVSVGSVIDFAIDPIGWDGNDGTQFNITISGDMAVPEPGSASLALLGLAAVVAPAARKRAKRARQA